MPGPGNAMGGGRIHRSAPAALSDAKRRCSKSSIVVPGEMEAVGWGLGPWRGLSAPPLRPNACGRGPSRAGCFATDHQRRGVHEPASGKVSGPGRALEYSQMLLRALTFAPGHASASTTLLPGITKERAHLGQHVVGACDQLQHSEQDSPIVFLDPCGQHLPHGGHEPEPRDRAPEPEGPVAKRAPDRSAARID